MVIRAYVVHASLQVLALISASVGAYNARKHRLRMHHRTIYVAVASTTLAVAIMLLRSRGLPMVHGKLGFSIYLLILAAAASGRVFLQWKITRSQHRALAYLTIFLLIFMILHGLSSFVL